ncbi:MAG TPA: hypothetical protein VMK65_09270 [Longimicrobiales bacterium]|nr:hypothetical protein [Longimicrobiales bacterium]
MRLLNLAALALAAGVFLHGAYRIVVWGETLRDHWPSMLVALGYGTAFFAFGFLPRETALWVVLLGLAAALPGFGAQIWRGWKRR